MSILRDLFGPSSWGVGGNLIAQALITLPALLQHRREMRTRLARIEARVTRHPSGRGQDPGRPA